MCLKQAIISLLMVHDLVADFCITFSHNCMEHQQWLRAALARHTYSMSGFRRLASAVSIVSAAGERTQQVDIGICLKHTPFASILQLMMVNIFVLLH